MKILFVYDHKYPHLWKDGLWAALNILEKDGFEIEKLNIQDYIDKKYKSNSLFGTASLYPIDKYDFILGWGAFNSPVDYLMHEFIKKDGAEQTPIGLCIAGNSFPPKEEYTYDVLFYETEWYLPQIMSHPNVVHAFGVNTEIYKPEVNPIFIWDWITVGSFSNWKRQDKLIEKGGYKLAVGEVQKENMNESGRIMNTLLTNGVMISDMVEAEQLAKIYNAAEKVYIPADINGGGERAVLEARACGRPVEIEFDNPKLFELLRCDIWNEYYYFDKLKAGILSCFK